VCVVLYVSWAETIFITPSVSKYITFDFFTLTWTTRLIKKLKNIIKLKKYYIIKLIIFFNKMGGQKIGNI
jgi:hypothetical protein